MCVSAVLSRFAFTGKLSYVCNCIALFSLSCSSLLSQCGITPEYGGGYWIAHGNTKLQIYEGTHQPLSPIPLPLRACVPCTTIPAILLSWGPRAPPPLPPPLPPHPWVMLRLARLNRARTRQRQSKVKCHAKTHRRFPSVPRCAFSFFPEEIKCSPSPPPSRSLHAWAQVVAYRSKHNVRSLECVVILGCA